MELVRGMEDGYYSVRKLTVLPPSQGNGEGLQKAFVFLKGKSSRKYYKRSLCLYCYAFTLFFVLCRNPYQLLDCTAIAAAGTWWVLTYLFINDSFTGLGTVQTPGA